MGELRACGVTLDHELLEARSNLDESLVVLLTYLFSAFVEKSMI